MIDAIGCAMRRMVRWVTTGSADPYPPVNLPKHDRILHHMEARVRRRDAVTRRYVSGARPDRSGGRR